MGFGGIAYHPCCKPIAIYSVAAYAIFHWPLGLKRDMNPRTQTQASNVSALYPIACLGVGWQVEIGK
jgi:hypothetical protein